MPQNSDLVSARAVDTAGSPVAGRTIVKVKTNIRAGGYDANRREAFELDTMRRLRRRPKKSTKRSIPSLV